MRRIGRPTAAFGLKEAAFYKDRQYNPLAKVCFLREEVIPALLYGIAIWDISEKDVRAMESFFRLQIMKIYRISWKDRIGYFRILQHLHENGITIYPMHILIAKTHLKYFGTVARSENWRLTKLVHYGTIVNTIGSNKVRKGLSHRSRFLVRDRLHEDLNY
jgi:hypothetical protein